MDINSNPKAKLLLDLASKAPQGLIVEIGCIRDEKEVFEDGFSTPYFAQFAQNNGYQFLSFDIEPKCVEIANRVLKNYGLATHAEIGDGKDVLKNLTLPISFLFLDSHRHPDFSFQQLLNAELEPGAIVAVDDAQPIDNYEFGKAHFIKQVLDTKEYPYSIVDTFPGWRTLWFEYPRGKTKGIII